MLSSLLTMLKWVSQAVSFSRSLGSASSILKTGLTTPLARYLVLTLGILLILSLGGVWYFYNKHESAIAEAATTEALYADTVSELQTLKDSLKIKEDALKKLAEEKRRVEARERANRLELNAAIRKLSAKDRECLERRIPPSIVRMFPGKSKD